MSETMWAERRLNLTYGERVYSMVHRRWVRFIRWVDVDFAEVMENDTLAALPDLVHRELLA
jgi:aryl carrier-like protein